MSDDLKSVTVNTSPLPTTMKGLGKLKAEPGIWEMTAPIPDCGPEDVLIRITHTAICGTDVHIYNWGRVGAKDDSGADDHRPRIRRRDRPDRRPRHP